MNPLGKFALAAAIGVIVVGAGLSLTGQLTGPGDQPTAVPSASVAPSLDLAAFTRRGTYVGPTLQVADIVATVNADASLTAADRTQIIDQFLAVRGKETLSISIDFYGGQLTQRETVNATTVVGSFGSYAFPDDHTLIYTESIDGEDVVTEFDISVNGDSFTLHRTTPAHGAADEFVTRLIFESGPFVLR